MKKLIAIALIASLTLGSALQAKKHAKAAPKTGPKRLVLKPMKPISDPKELNDQISSINKKIRKTIRKRDRFINDRTREANKGNLKLVDELTDKIRAKDLKIAKNRAFVRMYTMRLADIRASEIQAEKAKEAKKEKKKPKKAKRVRKRKKTKKAKKEKAKVQSSY